MSSAAIQAGGTAIANRQYQQPSHGRDQYYGQQPGAAVAATSSSSPSSSRKPVQRPSGMSPHSNPMTPQQAHFSHHPASPGSHSSHVTTPRAVPLPPSTHASPASPPAATSSYASTSGPPIAPPPRTSSQARNNTPAEVPMASRPGDPRAPSSSRPSQPSVSSQAGISDRERSKDDSATAAANAAQSRRRGQNSSKDSPRQQRSSDATRSRQAPTQSRSASAAETSLPREDSTIINRLVIADPQEDIARERARQAEARPAPTGADLTPTTGLGLVGSDGIDDGGRGGGRSRHDHSKSDRSRKETRFGEYILGQTLGEGEFGKVKMGWKKDGGVQVAIKLIRRESLGSNPSRLPKIYREIAILRELQHPNIVRLHEMVETERHIGIILEYASGGELFDYILNHRYLKDSAARRLFAQLVSGVGYLHKKGIVHRDLKLENLLLDRNRNIIITDFGFANTFDPNDELGEDIEFNLTNRDFVKKMNLEQTGDHGHRRGDLMQTSCGSPCYAAPELVVSDSLYTGRKVDVWSCGVILYAMLAGYLPFDDDPANPEGDNINLLYKYIVSTPLTFPDYVTPHAKDLLRRILVPDPRKRADLFEVARHSWLSEYAHVVAFITSTTTTESDIANATVGSDSQEGPMLARSASVREAGKSHSTVVPVGGLAPKHGHVDRSERTEAQKPPPRDAKRRTVQVEYVAPQSQTVRGETSPPAVSAEGTGAAKTRARQDHGPVEVPDSHQAYSSRGQTQRPLTQPPSRPPREPQRAVSDNAAFGSAPVSSATRPSTGGTIGGGSRLPSRGNSYGQPAAATVAATNAQGHFSQPKGKQYIISGPVQQPEPNVWDDPMARPNSQRVPSGYQAHVDAQSQQRSHRRSNTVSGIADKLFGRTGSVFSGRPSNEPSQRQQKSYPPPSMPGPIPNDDGAAAPGRPRPSTDSRRSFGFNRKNSDVPSGGRERGSRRFSFLPASFSMKSFTTNAHRGYGDPPGTSHSADVRRVSAQKPPSTPRSRTQSRHQPAGPVYGQSQSRSPSQSTTGSGIPTGYDHGVDRTPRATAPTSAPAHQTRFAPAPQQHNNNPHDPMYDGSGLQYPDSTRDGDFYQQPGSYENTDPRVQSHQDRPRYPAGFDPEEPRGGGGRPSVLHKSHRRFNDAYEAETGQHGGSSGAARRVMDLFRRRGRAREDR